MPEQFTEAEQRHDAPYSIREATFTLYLSNNKDEAVREVWVGGCLEELQPQTEFAEMRWDVQGDVLGRIYQHEEIHKLRIRQLWVMQKSSRKMALFRPNQRYVLVVRWYDQDAGTWVKHTYLRVTVGGRDLPIQEQVYYQDLSLNAFFLIPESGMANSEADLPDMNPTVLTTLRYVGNGEKIDLYRYNYGTNLFEVIDAEMLAGRAQIVEGTGFFKIEFEDVLALEALLDDGGLLLVNELTAIGGTFALSSVEPRLEFWVGPHRIAALTKAGELIVPNVLEGDDPVISSDLELKVNGNWIASFRQGLATVINISDDLQSYIPDPPFDPSTVSGIIAWHSADFGVLTSVSPDVEAQEGDTVRLWLDRSGFDNHFFQETFLEQPLYLDGRLDFDGVSQRMFKSFNRDAPYTIVIVSQNRNPAYRARLIHSINVVIYNDTTVYNFYPGGSGGVDCPAPDGELYTSFSYVRSDNLRYDIDVADQTAGEDVGSPLGSSLGFTTLGSSQFGSQFFDGKVCEFIVYNRVLDPEEKQYLRDGLAAKWGAL